MNGNFVNRIFIGLIVVAVGVIFLLNSMDYIDFSIGDLFSTFWPLILIYIGAVQLLTNWRNASGWWGGFILVLGCIFLGDRVNIPILSDLSIGDIIRYCIPIFIILVGVRMILKPRSKQDTPPADEWKSYGPFGQSQDVPPAPPLHPDPTKMDADEQHADKDGKYSSDHKSNYNTDYDSNYDTNYNSEPHGQYKKNGSTSKGCKHSHKEYVEWWNHGDPNVQNRSGFIGDIHLGQDYWELKPMNISHFIGDTVLDLTKAHVAYGETKINISSFIGDVKVYVPDDYEIGVQVVSNAFIGDVKILGQKEGGMFTNINIKSPRFVEADKKIKLIVSTFIGDVRVTKVG